MSETLFLRLRDQIDWVRYDDFGRQSDSGRGSDDDIRAQFGDTFAGDVVVIVPGEAVLLTRAMVPSRQARQIAQAVPYVVEEELAADVEDCFFAMGPRLRSGAVSVSVVAISQMSAWVSRVAGLGLTPAQMVAENELVVTEDDSIQVVVDGGRAHAGSDEHHGLSVDLPALPLAVSLLESQGAVKLQVSHQQAADIELLVSEIAASGQTVDVETGDDALTMLIGGYGPGRTNLLQGQFQVEQRRSPSGTAWRSVAMLAGAAFLLHMLLLTGQGFYLSSKASQYEQEAMALYKSIFPNDRNVRDVRRRWNANLGRSGGSDGNAFLALFAQSSRGLMSAGLTLQGVNFNESRGDLILQVMGPRSEALVQYAQRLNGQGLNAEIGTISQEDNTVRGSIKVRMSGS